MSINDFIQECLDEIVNIKDPIISEIMIKELSELTSIDQKNIIHVLNEKIEKRQRFKRVENLDTNDKKETVLIDQKYSKKLYDDLIRLCFAKDKEIRVLIFEHLNPEWILSNTHKEIYNQIYIHLKSTDYPPISIIAEQNENKDIRQKFIDLTFDIEKFVAQYNMVIDCLVRIEQTIVKNKINLLREKLKDAEDNIELLTQLSKLEKETNNIAQKYVSK